MADAAGMVAVGLQLTMGVSKRPICWVFNTVMVAECEGELEQVRVLPQVAQLESC